MTRLGLPLLIHLHSPPFRTLALDLGQPTFLIRQIGLGLFLSQSAFFFQPPGADFSKQALDFLHGDVQALGHIRHGGPVGQARLRDALLLPQVNDGLGLVRRHALRSERVWFKRVRVVVSQAHFPCYTRQMAVGSQQSCGVSPQG